MRALRAALASRMPLLPTCCTGRHRPLCLLDDLQHRLLLGTRWDGSLEWVCDAHDRAITGEPVRR